MSERPATGEADTVSVQVLLFARLRREAGWSATTIDVAAGTTVRALAARLSDDSPTLVLEGCMCAVDERYAAADLALRGGETVAFLPPVSGG